MNKHERGQHKTHQNRRPPYPAMRGGNTKPTKTAAHHTPQTGRNRKANKIDASQTTILITMLWLCKIASKNRENITKSYLNRTHRTHRTHHTHQNRRPPYPPNRAQSKSTQNRYKLNYNSHNNALVAVVGL